MTMLDLEQLRPLRSEIKMHDKQLRKLEWEYEAAHWSEKVQEVWEIIEGQRRRCKAQLAELEGFIAGIKDDFTRQVFTLRYADGLAWKEVAGRAPGINRSDAMRAIVSRYLERESA